MIETEGRTKNGQYLRIFEDTCNFCGVKGGMSVCCIKSEYKGLHKKAILFEVRNSLKKFWIKHKCLKKDIKKWRL